MEKRTISRSQILQAVTQYYEDGDLSFIDTLNNITFGYKVSLKQNLTKIKDERRMD
jgi:hypothetical protein